MKVRDQWEVFILQLKIRTRRPCKPATIAAYESFWRVWIEPHLGNMDLSKLENGAMRQFVSVLTQAKLSPASIVNIIQVVKGIVASAVDSNGNEKYARTWNNDFMDLPIIVKEDQETPILDAGAVQGAILEASGQYAPLFALLAATGLRINEALALKMGSHPESSYWSPRQSKLVIRKGLYRGQEQSPKTVSGVREVDLAPRINDYLISCLKDRAPGDFLFTNHNGGPLCLQSVYDAKKELGLPGLHSFRRFRITHLEKMDVPRGLAMFWTGHAAGDVHEIYIKMGKDIKARKDWAEKAGIGFELPTGENYVEEEKQEERQEEMADV